MKFHLTAGLGLVLLLGCLTGDIVKSSIQTADLVKLEEIEVMLLEYKFNNTTSILTQARQKLTALKQNASYNKEYEAKIYGLLGEVSYYEENTSEVEGYIVKIEALFNSEERLFVLKSFLAKDIKLKLSILQEGLSRANSSGLLYLYLAELYFSQNDFRQASANYDEAFSRLNEVYKKYYGKKRDLAFQFMSNPPASVAVSDILTQETLKVKDVIGLIQMETDFFKNITPDKSISAGSLLNKLVEAGYFHNKAINPEDVCRRKDVAFLLINICAYMEKNPALLNSYQQMFKASGQLSPVPDVFVSDYYFDAVLTLVEREIMELPDGKNFSPEKSISGLEFQSILNRLKAYY